MPRTQRGPVTLVAVRLDATPEGSSALHPVELARADAMPAGPERDRFLNGRIAIRELAAELLGGRPEELVLDFACANCGRAGAIDHGRPGYRAPNGGPEVRLSLSRSGPWCLLAGTTHPAIAALGADLENASRADFAGFDDVVLTPGERLVLAGLADGSEAPRMRARFWARKEAFLKATGAGLFREPSTVEAAADLVEGVELADVDPAPLDLPAGLVAAVAVRRAR